MYASCPVYLILTACSEVVNGERNRIIVMIENQSDRNVTLKNIAGSFHHPETNALVKNVSPMLQALSLPYVSLILIDKHLGV